VTGSTNLFHTVRFEAQTVVKMKITILWDVMLVQSVRKAPKFRNSLQPPSSEQKTDFYNYQAARHHIPEDNNLRILLVT
jgi:hypothetical protein